MKTIILIFAAVMTVLSLAVMFRAKFFTDFLLNKLGTVWMTLLAGGVRIGMGWVMLQAVPISRFPRTFEVLGWLFIIAGVVILLIPPRRLQQFARWAFERFRGFAALGGLAGIALAAFLAYAVW
jgi:hypothetical protein